MRKLFLSAIAASIMFAGSGRVGAEVQAAVCPPGAKGDAAAQEAAGKLLESLMNAYDHLKRDFGDDILTSRKAEVDTPQGRRTIGDVWGEYLEQAGYPQPDTIQQCVDLLAPAGLSDTALTILVLAPASYDGLEDLAAGLNKIANKAP